jgi:hypothetical protein
MFTPILRALSNGVAEGQHSGYVEQRRSHKRSRDSEGGKRTVQGDEQVHTNDLLVLSTSEEAPMVTT